ncbi:MAG: hypothetical protein LBU35_03115 [Holosporales bacterium]|nr:hypothetical protein [Holosporales bacterium]
MPQLDSSSYCSQLFWLFISLSVLVLLFKKYFIPRMNLIIEKRDGHISKYNSEIEKLECDVKILSENLREIQNNSIIKSAEMIHAATKKSSEFLDEQIKIIKKENEELLNGIKKRLEEEIKSLDSAFKTQIEITSQIIFNKLLERKI